MSDVTKQFLLQENARLANESSEAEVKAEYAKHLNTNICNIVLND